MRIPGERRRAAGPARDGERSSFPRALELCGPLGEGDGSAAEAEVAERDGAGGTGERSAGTRASFSPTRALLRPRCAGPRPPRSHCEVRRRRVGPGRDPRERPPRPVAAAASAGPFTGYPGQT